MTVPRFTADQIDIWLETHASQIEEPLSEDALGQDDTGLLSGDLVADDLEEEVDRSISLDKLLQRLSGGTRETFCIHARVGERPVTFKTIAAERQISPSAVSMRYAKLSRMLYHPSRAPFVASLLGYDPDTIFERPLHSDNW
tara:strand:- start:13128 stop:13553 length:426 start_codon:yes stop_codon:yes gene_type:complete